MIKLTLRPQVSPVPSTGWRGRAGDPAGAAAALQDLLTDQLRVLGPDHPHTLTARNNLATWRRAAGQAENTV